MLATETIDAGNGHHRCWQTKHDTVEIFIVCFKFELNFFPNSRGHAVLALVRRHAGDQVVVEHGGDELREGQADGAHVLSRNGLAIKVRHLRRISTRWL